MLAPENQKEIKPCTPSRDRECGCIPGFYNKVNGSLECWKCYCNTCQGESGHSWNINGLYSCTLNSYFGEYDAIYVFCVFYFQILSVRHVTGERN